MIEIGDIAVGDVPIGILGAGGHGSELAWLVERRGISRNGLRFLIDPQFESSDFVDGIEVMISSDFTKQYPFAPILLGIGDPDARKAASERLAAAGHFFPSLIALDAVVAESAHLSNGVIVFPRSYVSVHVVLGEHVHINAGCLVSHDVQIGAFSNLSPGVTVCGNVRIEKSVFIGAGSTIINSTPNRPITIDDKAFVAAGSCVTSSVSRGVRVAGVPARPMRCRREIKIQGRPADS